jgi:hypothetical protein
VNNPQIRRVDWFLSFLKRNFNEIPRPELFAMLGELSEVFGRERVGGFASVRTWMMSEEPNQEEFNEVKTTLSRYQTELSDFIDNMMGKLGSYLEYCSNTKDPRQDLVALKAVETIAATEFAGQAILRIKYPFASLDPRQLLLFSWPMEKAQIELVLEPSESEKAFLYSFLRTISGMNLRLIKRCKECGSWYVQARKRERLYCSDRCRAKKGNRERRKALKEQGGPEYELELEKGSERAKKAYDKKVREEINFNVKIGRDKRRRDENGTTN